MLAHATAKVMEWNVAAAEADADAADALAIYAAAYPAALIRSALDTGVSAVVDAADEVALDYPPGHVFVCCLDHACSAKSTVVFAGSILSHQKRMQQLRTSFFSSLPVLARDDVTRLF